jgi:hypothetical protein
MIARDAPATETLAAIAGVTIVDRAERELEMAVFPSLEKDFADAIAGVPLGPPHVGTL